MRHNKKQKILGRGTSERKALIRSLVKSFFINEKIYTTSSKAKLIKPIIEKVITLGKKDNLTNRRRIIQLFNDNNLANKIIKDISPRYNNRAGGYTKILKLGFRKGDDAPMVFLKLT